jgi:hypothetical protein
MGGVRRLCLVHGGALITAVNGTGCDESRAKYAFTLSLYDDNQVVQSMCYAVKRDLSKRKCSILPGKEAEPHL